MDLCLHKFLHISLKKAKVTLNIKSLGYNGTDLKAFDSFVSPR
jgi:hypothetical protein